MDKSIKAKIRWSKIVRTITWISSLLIVLSIILISVALQQKGFNWIGIIVLFLMFFVFIYTLISAPVSIEVDDSCITVRKIIGFKRINRSDLIDVYPFPNNGYSIRLFGSGGLFGYTGIFKNKYEGRYISYVGDYDQAYFLILKSGKKYLISSEHRELIMSIIKEKL